MTTDTFARLDKLADRGYEVLRAVFDFAPDAILVVDNKGAVVLANRQAQFLFGRSVQQLIGTPVEELMPERFRAEHPVYRRKYLDNPHPRPMGDGAGLQLMVSRLDGAEVGVSISLNAFMTDDSQQYVITIIRRNTDGTL